mgnify:CR=1 FL=1
MGLNLDELNRLARTVDDPDEEDCCQIKAAEGEVVGESPEEDSTLEENLTEALDLLEQALLMFESMRVHRGNIIKIPGGMRDLMEEMADLLDEYEINRD